MAQSGITVQTVIDQDMEYIRKNDPGSYTRLNADESKKYVLVEKIKEIVNQEIEQSKQLDQNGNDLTKLALPAGRLKAIKRGLEMATYRIEIADRVAK